MADESAFEAVCKAIRGEMKDDGVQWLVGGRYQQSGKSKRAVAWMWPNGRIMPPEAGTVDIVVNGSTVRYKNLYTNHASVVAMIMGESMYDVESTWARVLTATDATCGKSSVPGPYRVPTEEERERHSMAKRQCIMQTFEWQMRMLSADGSRLATLVTLNHTCVISYDLA